MKENIIYRADPHNGGANMSAARGDSQYSPEPPAGAAQGDYVMRDALRESIGCYIVSDHLVGTSEMQSREGQLVRVESNFYVLYDEDSNTYQACDYYSLKFFRRWPKGQRPAPGSQLQPQPRNMRR